MASPDLYQYHYNFISLYSLYPIFHPQPSLLSLSRLNSLSSSLLKCLLTLFFSSLSLLSPRQLSPNCPLGLCTSPYFFLPEAPQPSPIRPSQHLTFCVSSSSLLCTFSRTFSSLLSFLLFSPLLFSPRPLFSSPLPPSILLLPISTRQLTVRRGHMSIIINRPPRST